MELPVIDIPIREARAKVAEYRGRFDLEHKA